MAYDFIRPPLDAGNATPDGLRRHTGQISRSLESLYDIIADLNARLAALEPAPTDSLFLLEDGTSRLLLEDGTTLLALE
jgi:hypothetical protein